MDEWPEPPQKVLHSFVSPESIEHNVWTDEEGQIFDILDTMDKATPP